MIIQMIAKSTRNDILKIVEESALFNDCGFTNGGWCSGWSPIRCWEHRPNENYEVEIDLECDDLRKVNPRSKKLIAELQEKFPNTIYDNWFCKSDGSCPSTFHFYIGKRW